MKVSLPLALLLAVAAPAAFADSSNQSADDQALAWIHAEDTMQLSDVPLVTGHASSEAVTQFAQSVQDDLNRIEDAVKKVAAAQSADVDGLVAANADIATATQSHTAAQAAFKDLTGAAFDKAFLQHAIDDANNAIKELQDIGDSATNSDVIDVLDEALAVQEDHQVEATLLLETVNSSK